VLLNLSCQGHNPGISLINLILEFIYLALFLFFGFFAGSEKDSVVSFQLPVSTLEPDGRSLPDLPESTQLLGCVLFGGAAAGIGT